MSVSRLRQHGFTMLEFVIVITIIGVIAAMATRMYTGPMMSYMDIARRAALVDLADTSLRKMQRDIRGALPNSVRVTSSGSAVAIEFVPIAYAGRYRNNLPGDPLDLASTDTSFNVLNSTSFVTADLANLRLAVAPTVTSDIYSGSSTALTPTATTFTVSSSTVAGVSETLVTLSAGYMFPYASPQKRFYFVSSPVSYVCDTSAHTVTRYSGYGYSAAQSTTPGGTGNLLVNKVTACTFAYTTGTDARNAVVRLSITLTDSTGGNPETITLMEQMHVNNAP